MSEYEARVLADLSVLKSQMSNLMESSTGRLPLLEASVAEHGKSLERAKGFACAFGAVVTVVQVVVEWVRH